MAMMEPWWFYLLAVPVLTIGLAGARWFTDHIGWTSERSNNRPLGQ